MVSDRFPDVAQSRLPSLFGAGLQEKDRLGSLAQDQYFSLFIAFSFAHDDEDV